MASFSPRLLTPPEEEELYPYRRVWRSLSIETAVLLAIAAMLSVLVNFIGVQFPSSLYRPLNIVLALTPLGLWLIFSWAAERSVPEPRQRLLLVLIVTTLAANAVGTPLVNQFFQVERWLPLANTIFRIVGYTFTVGLVQTMILYLVIRYIVWKDSLRLRIDSIAYALAGAVGYATVLNLHLVSDRTIAPDVAAIRVFNTTALLFGSAVLIGYGLADVRFSRPSPLLMTFWLGLAATITGIIIPLRAGLVNAALSLEVSAASPLRGLGLSAAVVFLLSTLVGLLIQNAERQEREAAGEEE